MRDESIFTDAAASMAVKGSAIFTSEKYLKNREPLWTCLPYRAVLHRTGAAITSNQIIILRLLITVILTYSIVFGIEIIFIVNKL